MFICFIILNISVLLFILYKMLSAVKYAKKMISGTVCNKKYNRLHK